MSEESGILVDVPESADDAAEEEENNDHHAGTEGLIQLRRGFDAAQIHPGEEGREKDNPDVEGEAGRIFMAALAQKAVQMSGLIR